MMDTIVNNCFICDKHLSGEDVEELDKRGINLLIRCSEKKSDGKAAALIGLKTVTVHKKCEKFYCFCFICDKDVTSEDVRTVRERGIATLINCSEKRCDGKGAGLVGLSAVTVHEKCRKLYTNEKSINAFCKRPQASRPVAHKNPSGEQLFCFEEKCLFCAKEITPEFLTNESKKTIGKRNRVFKIRNANTKESVINAANQRDDDWGLEVIIKYSLSLKYK